ncbi:hypothetical protein [Nonomuraea sp. 10N515B]|uniref:hypothetical protein n=1 Tax=Nonomuraea sp. 10N515B TaxID=3457422 RepID=UPI003FCD9FFE
MDVLNLIGGRWVDGEGEEFADTNLGAADIVDREWLMSHINSEPAGTFRYVPFGGTKQSYLGALA